MDEGPEEESCNYNNFRENTGINKSSQLQVELSHSTYKIKNMRNKIK